MTNAQLVTYEKYQDLFQAPQVMTLFEKALGDRAGNFVAAAISVINDDQRLAKCTPPSLLTACMQFAAHDLSPHPQAGQGWIIPYGEKAKFQLGYKGLAHMALRTGQYEVLNTNYLTGSEEVVIDKLSGKVTGINGDGNGNPHSVFSYFKLKDGREGVTIMSLDEIEAFAKKYSKAYSKKDSPWQDEEHGRTYMEFKTVLMQNLKRNHAPIDWFNRGEAYSVADYESDNGELLEADIEAQVREIGMANDLQAAADPDTGELDLGPEERFWAAARQLNDDPRKAEDEGRDILDLAGGDYQQAYKYVQKQLI